MLNLHNEGGVFEKTDAGGVRFHEAPPPSKDDVGEVAQRVRDRAVRWLRRRGYLDERAAEERSNGAAEPSAIDGCTQLALAGGAFLARPPSTPNDTTDADLERRERRFSATCDGFDVHCAVCLAAEDDLGRERLVRYCTWPPFALEPIEVLRDGRIAYLLKVPRKGRTHRLMTPMEFMARLAALLPRPRIPLVRYHGVFASRSSWRALVTPKPPAGASKPKACTAPASPSAASPAAFVPASPVSAFAPPPVATPRHAALGEASAESVVHVDPTRITVAPWGRLEDGALFAWSRRLAWAVRRKRTFGFAVLIGPRCARKMRVISTLPSPAVVRKRLDPLGVRASLLPRAPARDPDGEQTALGFDADAASLGATPSAALAVAADAA